MSTEQGHGAVLWVGSGLVLRLQVNPDQFDCFLPLALACPFCTSLVVLDVVQLRVSELLHNSEGMCTAEACPGCVVPTEGNVHRRQASKPV